eukprot:GFYU01007214.1.p1 GENE.GFYU01007214.1~~GFYU01007214.1.p1  ORF type:complete len:133 (+),score=24.38 GFYU01007214.1:53-400(+)
MNEEQVFHVITEGDLMVLGWIHTHPSQTCFLSSIDVHTQFSYQTLMPEAVAIVMAPQKSPSMGVFRLTDPPGMETIRNCTLSGFHVHGADETSLFENCSHVKVISSDVTVLDFRG